MLPLLASTALAGLAYTAPPPDPASYPDLRGRDTVTVLLLGDSGVGESFAPVAKAAAETCFADTRAAKCDLALLLGDNVYDEGITEPGAQAWVDAFATPMAPFSERAKGEGRFRAWVVAGNHDWGHGADAAGEARIAAAMATTKHPANAAGLWQYPALVYEVPGLPDWLHLFGVDTQLVVEGKGSAVLDAARAAMRRTSGWDVVFGHHPPASTGGHGADPDERHDEIWARALQSMRPLGLSLVLAGHDHHQEVLVSGGVPVVIQGNSAKGRDVHGGKYADCSRWTRAGKASRGFAIATFRADEVTVELFDGSGGEVHRQSWKRDEIPAKGPRLGTCKAEKQ